MTLDDLTRLLGGRRIATYVASAGVNRAAARAMAAELTARGCDIVSSWHEVPPFDSRKDGAIPANVRTMLAQQCLAEVETADLVVVIGHAEMRGGYVEAGAAIAFRKRLAWVGDTTTIFASFADVELA